MASPALPLFKISYLLDRREWQLEGGALPYAIRFAEGGPGAPGLIGAIHTALFTGRQTGGILEIRFLDESHQLRFRGRRRPTQGFPSDTLPRLSKEKDFL